MEVGISRQRISHAKLRLSFLLASLVLIALTACTIEPPKRLQPSADQARFTAVPFEQLPGWTSDDHLAALNAFRTSCENLLGGPSDRTLGGTAESAVRGGTPMRLRPACTAARIVQTPSDARNFFERYFQPFEISDATQNAALFTGYYEPEIRGVLTPQPGFPTPLLARPSDLIQADLGHFNPELSGKTILGRVAAGALIPYFDRAAIEDGVLDNKQLALAWVADPADAFFLQIQGSGRLVAPDGSVHRLRYAAQNGRPYIPIGRLLAQRGEIPLAEVSMQTIRAWLTAHPDAGRALMRENPSYIFFRMVPDTDPTLGPIGSLGVNLSPLRSLAVDRQFIPLGSPVFIETTDTGMNRPIRQLMMAQDTGGAIKGPNRADIFFGWGRNAEESAGRMRGTGHLFILLPN